MKLVAILTGLLLLAGIVECALHRARVRKIPLRILVNGTRGKTSVTRQMTAALQEAGVRTYGKCTGSKAMYLLPDGSEEPVKRRRGPRLTEQIALFRRAVKADAQAVVVECMAVLPESQTVLLRLVNPTIVIMTNARVDHVAEMGNTEADTVRTLALSLPKEAAVVTGDTRFAPYAREICPPDAGAIDERYMESFDYPVFEENLRLVLACAARCGVDREVALRGMKNAKPDIGMSGPYIVGDCVVVNAFAANDCDSSSALFRRSEASLSLGDKKIRVLFNNRSDREYRLKEFVPLLEALAKRCAGLSVIGENARKVARYFHGRSGISADAPGKYERVLGLLEEDCVLFCLGNIKGEGMAFLTYLQENGGRESASASDRT